MKYSNLNGKLYGLSKDYGSDTKWFCFLKPTWQQKMLCIFQRERCLMQMSYNGDLDNDQMVLLLNLDLFLTAVRKVRPAHQAPVCWTLINIAMHKMHKSTKAVQNAHIEKWGQLIGRQCAQLWAPPSILQCTRCTKCTNAQSTAKCTQRTLSFVVRWQRKDWHLKCSAMHTKLVSSTFTS